MNLLLLAAVAAAAGMAAPRLAILDEPGFPYYMAESKDSPRLFADLFRAVGLEVERLPVTELADPRAFNADTYAAYVHVYGNTFPLEACDNLSLFHRAGGCLILTSGVPFCHPVVARGAAGWSLTTTERTGRTLDAAHSGKASLRVHNAAADGWAGPASPRFPVEPGQRYVVGGWIKVERTIPAHDKSVIYLRFFDRNGTFTGQHGPLMPHEVCDWTRVEAEVTVPEGAATADVSPQLWAPGGEVLIDDLFLHKADGRATNLLADPSFEQPGGGWTDLGHDGKYQTHDGGLGTGSFISVEEPGDFSLSPFGREMGLDVVPWEHLPGPQFVQTLDPRSLPDGDEVRPIVSLGDPARGAHPAAMIVHGCPTLRGAVDVWCRSHCAALSKRPFYQVVLKSTIAALQQKGELSPAEAKAMVAKADEVLKPEFQGYEPVAEERPFPDPWPRSRKPADTILVCDVSEAGPHEEFALTVLQGLVNRERPRLYLVHSRYAQQDRQWLDELRFEGLKTEEISIADLRKRFGDVPAGVIVYDRAIMDEIGAYQADRLNLTNVILMLCAVHNAIPYAAQSGVKLSLPYRIILDTRDRWDTPYAMYEWAYENLWPQMNHHILATLYPGIFYLTDYLVQHKVFTFWFASERTLREQELLEGILASTPPNTPIVGWWFCWMPNVQDPAHRSADCVGEGEGVRLGSAFAKFLTPSHECTNLSVHSGMPLLDHKHKPVSHPVALDRTKVYYSFIMSDGDNLGECLMMRRRESRWDVPERGQVPMGWSHAPASAVLAPPALNYYLRTATDNDYLVGGLGIAYTQPDVYATAFPDQREGIFAEYARMTAEALKPLDTNAVWLIGGSKSNVSRYAQADGQLRAIFPDYGTGAKRPYENVTYTDANGVSVFRAVTGWGGDEPYADRLVREIRAASDGVRPAFLHVFLLNWGTAMPMLQEVMKRLGDEYVCVRPHELDRLYRESQ